MLDRPVADEFVWPKRHERRDRVHEWNEPGLAQPRSETDEILFSKNPQAVLPIAWDQKDNATRVKRLGAGNWMRAGRATGPRLARLLKGLLTPEARERSGALGARFANTHPLDVAADHLETLVAVSGPPPRR